MENTGVKADRGSWKIIDISLPRIFDISLSVLPMSSWPRSFTEPVTFAYSGSRPIIAMEVTDLPEPDSPTMPSVRPGKRSKSTPRTAWTRPASEGNATSRSRTESNGVCVVGALMLCLVNSSSGQGHHVVRQQYMPWTRSVWSKLQLGSRSARVKIPGRSRHRQAKYRGRHPAFSHQGPRKTVQSLT